MRFDLIIPTYKPDKKFELLLKWIGRQTRQPDRIIVINTEEDLWKKPEVWPSQMEVTHITREAFNHGGTRKMAAQMSDAPVFVCMTQDAVPADEHVFEELLRALEDDTIGVAYARQLAGDEVGVIEKYTRRFNYPAESQIKRKADEEKMGIKTWFCSDVCAAWRKSAWLEAGGFVERTIFNEDMLMAQKLVELGYGVTYQASSRVVHAHRYTCKQQFQRNFDLGVSHCEFKEVFSLVSSESEGIRMVKKTLKYLLKTGHWYLVPELIAQSGAKYLGYRLGKMYDKMPLKLVLKLSATPSYFKE